jgi:hypothetical protein
MINFSIYLYLCSGLFVEDTNAWFFALPDSSLRWVRGRRLSYRLFRRWTADEYGHGFRLTRSFSSHSFHVSTPSPSAVRVTESYPATYRVNPIKSVSRSVH